MTVELTLAQRFEFEEQMRRTRLYKDAADVVENVFEQTTFNRCRQIAAQRIAEFDCRD